MSCRNSANIIINKEKGGILIPVSDFYTIFAGNL